MSGATSNASISSLINQNQFLEEQAQGALIKSFRAATGQFKALAPLSVASSTTLVADTEFSFPIKANYKYILEGSFLISSAAAGGAKLALNAPANTSANSLVSGKVVSAGTTAAGSTIGNTTGLYDQTLNGLSLYSNAGATDAVYAQVFISPAVDDLLTISFAQNTSNATASKLLQGSAMNLLCLSSSRRAPNVV
jgi:hypothetical protein